MHRREFLKLTGLTGVSLLAIGQNAWAMPGTSNTRKKLVVVFLRGAADGLSIVVPYHDDLYYQMRPTIALQRPGEENGVLDLDGRFGLHPSLALMQPLWAEKSLAFVHASGSPDPSHSHFEAQGYMESGTPGLKSTQDGWLNRTLSHLEGPHASNQAVNLGPLQPHILQGSIPVATMATSRQPVKWDIQTNPAIQAAFAKLYSGSSALDLAYREGMDSQTRLFAALQKDMQEASMNAPPTDGLAYDAETVAKLMRNDSGIQICFIASGGWDTHVNQGSEQGPLSKRLTQLADGLSSLRNGLGNLYEDTVVLVISEFGRAAHENGNGGTDHGHGNVMWLMGGPVNGGKVYGNWPGLEEENLYLQRDLAITTDFRDVIATVLMSHLSITKEGINKIFPGMPAQGQNVSTLIRA